MKERVAEFVALLAFGFAGIILVIAGPELVRRLARATRRWQRQRAEDRSLRQVRQSMVAATYIWDRELVRGLRAEMGPDCSERELYARVYENVRDEEMRSPSLERCAALLRECRAAVAPPAQDGRHVPSAS